MLMTRERSGHLLGDIFRQLIAIDCFDDNGRLQFNTTYCWRPIRRMCTAAASIDVNSMIVDLTPFR
jgi:hypothetical protein